LSRRPAAYTIRPSYASTKTTSEVLWGGYPFRTYAGRWRAVRAIGRGGQGIVFEAEDTREELPRKDATDILKDAFKGASAVVKHMDDGGRFGELLDAIHKIAPKKLPRAAVKESLPLDDAVNPKTALERMRAELEAMHSVQPPAGAKH
jgi:hypothetical protein